MSATDNKTLPKKEETIIQDTQKLIDYMTNLSMLMLDMDKDKLYKTISSSENIELIKKFIQIESNRVICISKNEEENSMKPEFFIDSKLEDKGIHTSTIIFIKKNPTINCKSNKTIKNDLQILDFSNNDGNNNDIFLYMQNYLQTAFNPLFDSYQEKASADTSNTSSIKQGTYNNVKSKVNELVVLLNQAQKTSDIPTIKLECEPELKKKMDEIREKKKHEPTVEEIAETCDENYILKLCDLINKWKTDISKVIKTDRDVSQGDTLQEVNFWRDFETTLKNIKTQIESPEVEMTLGLVKNARKFFITKGFEEDTKIEEPIKRVELANLLLKDLPIVPMTTATSIPEIGNYIKKIFEHIKARMRISWYPITRMLQLIEVISKDLNAHLISVLGKNLMTMKFEDFIKIYKESKALFKESWQNEFEAVRKEIPIIQKLRNERNLISIPSTFEHLALQKRLKELKKFRVEHKNLVEITLSLTSNEADNQSESPLTREIDQAYLKVSEINILDLSKQGEINWNNAKNEYNKITEKIEGQISNSLSDQLASAQSPNAQFKIFEKFNKLIKRQRVQNAIQEYQTELVNSIIQSLSELKEKLLGGYNMNSASMMSKIKGLPEVSGRIIWLNQFKRKALVYKDKIAIVLGDNWETLAEGKRVKEIIDSIVKTSGQISRITDDWTREVIGLNIDSYSTEKIINIVNKQNNYELRVNFDEKLIDLFKEVRLIHGNFGNVSQLIISRSMENKGNYPFAIALQDAFKTFNNSCQKIKNEQKIAKLIAKQKKDIQDLIQANISTTWSNYPKLDRFTKEICEKVSSFEESVRDLTSKMSQIESLFSQIQKAELNQEFISEKIKSVQRIIDEISDCSNMQIWIKEMDQKLESILIQKLKETIDIWLKEFLAPKPLKEPILLQDVSIHKIKITDQLIYLEPSIYEAREFWYNQFHQALSIVLSNRRLEYRIEAQYNKESQFKESTYREIIKLIDQNILQNCYKKLENVFDECEEYVKTWLSYQVLWDIQPNNIYNKLGDDMDKWQQLMNELKAGRKTFDNNDTEKVFGSIVIDYSAVQSKINNKYDAWHKEIMNKFAEQTNVGMKTFYNTIGNARESLEKNSIEEPSSDIVQFITEVQEVKSKLKNWENEFEKYKNSKKILDKQRFRYPNDFTNMEQMESEWNKLLSQVKKKTKVMDEQIPAIRARVEADEVRINDKIKDLEKYWNEKKPNKSENPSDALNILKTANNMLKEIKDDYIKNCKAKELLGMDFSDPNKLDGLEEDIKDLQEVWGALNTIFAKIDAYKDTPFNGVIPERIKRDLDEALNQMNLLPSKMRTYEAFDTVKNRIGVLKKTNNLISDIRTEAIKERHWRQILKRLNIHKQVNDLILDDFWKINLLSYEKSLNEIIAQATGELVLENYIKKSKEIWAQYELDMVRYKDKCKLIRGWDDMFTLLDEHINSFQSMSNSPYYNVFKEEIEPWKDKLEKIRLLFNEWVDVQRRWVYLEGIFFGSADIMNELASDYNKFKTIDGEFTGLMKKVAAKPLVLEVVGIPSIQSILQEKLKTALERIQKALYNFLEKQRQAFARFYFIGDEDLLEIIGNSKDVHKITRHFNKMFAGMNSLVCEDGNEMTKMVSREFEEVPFETTVKINENPIVYVWLTKIQEQMQMTLAKKLEKAVNEISTMDYINKVDDFIKWIEKYPAQITVLSSQVLWSASIEYPLTGKKTLASLPNEFKLKDEENVINNMLGALSDQVLKDIKVDFRKKLEQLITELVHQRDVVRLLINKNVDNVNAFDWLYYMRFYFNPKVSDVLKQLQIKMSNASFDYGFEYLGVAEKLIQTPLTDRCYLTLTQGLYFRLGGAPFGPAGTGKTESVKALGGQLGRFVLVFNCDENFDFKAMGRIFVGLCQVGAWGCFDEFNRLEERILSAVSQQILIIQLGLREQADKIDLMGKNIKLNHQMGIFVTMNPGYAGRSQLPDNLKQLFRQMAMVKPDKDMIAQVTLYSQGYKTAERLSSKMVSLFELCESQLSSQSHYDFGLRALKSVLVNAGNLKRREDKEREKTQKDKDMPIETWEQNILLKSVCDTLIPKLVSEDITLFNSLLIGVFPDSKIEEVREDELREKIVELCKIRNLLPEEKFINKIIQLYSIQKMHHGVMMVGQSGTGKSAAWKILLEALQLIDNIKGESYIIDPKAVNKDNLYGKLDQTTLDWTDGVFTGTLRKILDNQRGESGKRHWIIFDGDVDPEWAENLNSVLDDNKLLTLPHGDRLQIPPNVRIMFEVESLKYATLATVSRCGMVWFSEDIVTTDMMYSHYLKRLTQVNYDDVMNYIATAPGKKDAFDNKTTNDGESHVREKAVEAIKHFFSHNGFVQQALEMTEQYDHIMEFSRIRVIESMFALVRKGTSNIIEYNENHSEFPFSDDQIFTYMSKWLVLSIIWGFGGSLSLGNRTEFSNKLKNLTSEIDFPNEAMFAMIDYEVKIGENVWQPWKMKVPNTEIETSKVSDADVVIPTVDTVRHQEVLCSWISEHRPFILCGPPGSGKTMTLMATLKILTDFEMVFINFSSSTTPDLILKTFDHYCEYVKSSSGTILRPKQGNKYLVIFCDEINLPEMDKYSTQVVITFLREITEQNGFWRPLDKTWIKLERIQFVGACNPPTDVGRHPLNNRFLRHCPLIYVDFPGKDSLKQIYGTFNRALLRKGPTDIHSCGESLTDAMVEFYTQCQQHYTPDIQPHYIYSPRELTRWKHALNESIENMNGVEDLVRLWAHEALRLFQDRLVLDDEKKWCDDLVDKIANQFFPTCPHSALERPILFTDLMNKTYVSCDKDELIKNIDGKLTIFYEEELNVPLVIFDSVLEHILRIDRVLKQPIGHLLLVGQSGVGKTTLSRFVAWMNNLTVFQIKAGRNYGVADFDADLRNIMKRSGCKGEKICFIFDESNVLGPAFLEKMNALLASGEIPGLFEGDEYISLINTAKEFMNKEGKGVEQGDTEEEIYKNFIKGVQRNLHVVFTMNPLSPDFSNRAASSPALYNRCVIDWFGDWSREGLYQVANKLTKDVQCELENFTDQKLNEDQMHGLVVNSITSYHMIIKELNDRLMKNAKKFNYITPRDFLDFIKHFIKLQIEKTEELNEQQVHINKGLQKIIETENTVNELKQSLNVTKAELDQKEKETKAKFTKIMEDNEKASKSKEKAEKQKIEIENMQKSIDERTKKVEYELSTVVPKMEAARAAIGNLTPKSVAVLKGLKKETENTRTPLKLSAILYSYCSSKKVISKMEWPEIRTCILKEDFIMIIKNMKAEELSDKVTEIVKKEMADPKNHWDIKKITSGFYEVGLLAEYIQSSIECADINNQMEPMKNEIANLNKQKGEVEEEFKKIIAEIDDLEKNIAQLKVDYENSVVESNAIKKNMEEVKNKVERSEKLLENLSSEKERWGQQMSDFKSQINNLLGDTFLSSSFLAYIGFYDASYRKYLREKARKILEQHNIISSKKLDEVEWLTKPNDKVIWQKCSLPSDNICTENATILQRFNRYPLIIDPAGQATEFIKIFYKEKKLNTTSFTDGNFLKTLESALRFGYPILVQDVEKIDPIMNSLLNKEIHKQGGRNLIRIGDQEIDFSPTFNMFMVTRDSSCHFTPDLCSRVTFLNFTITPSSLQNQILSIILKSERPEVDKAKEDLIKAQRDFKLQLRQLEEDLLSALNSEGNLLENDKVMSRLEDIKKKSHDISEEINKSDEVMNQLQSTMNEYMPIATMGSRIFFALDSLDTIFYLYKYSLTFFMDVLNYVINCKKLSEIPKSNYNERQNTITKILFKEIYHRVGYSLLNKDVLIFAMRLSQIRLNEKFKNEINLLLKINSNIMNDAEDVSENIIGGKLTLNQRKQISELIKNEPFKNLYKDINQNKSAWLNFYNDPKAENSIPYEFLEDKKNEQPSEKYKLIFEYLTKSILLLVFRPDRMLSTIDLFLKEVFDEEFVQIPELDLVKVVQEETNCKSPILFCSAPGFDASSKIESLARSLNKKFLSIAIGSSEGFELVEKNFPNKIKSGEWLVLKNVHLAPNWLNELEKKLYSNEPNANFRLFLTMEFNPKIPANVLRISRKFVFELPSGIKHSLIRSYANVLSSEKSERIPIERCRLHFLLAWFHAVIGERLRYVPIGWSKFYEFNESDQKCALDAIDEWIDIHAKDKQNISPDKIPWDAIRTIIHQSMYGGKIDNDYDMKILESLVNLYFNQKTYDFNYPLFKSSSTNANILTIPDKKNNAGYLEWINNLPSVESPEWSGLPNNAEKLVRETAARRFITEMNKIQGVEDEELSTVSDTEGKSTQASWLIVVENKSTKLLKGLPTAVLPLQGNEQSNNNPIFRFLRREVGVATKLLSRVRTDLEESIQMCKGNIKSTNELRLVVQNLFNDTVPKSWQLYPTLELNVTEWVIDFANRINQLNKVTKEKDYGKSDLWLGGLIFPEAYLTATRQAVAQELKKPLDELVLSVELVKNISSVPMTNYVCKGVCIEGAEWDYDNNKLIMTDSLFSQLPPFMLKWSVANEGDMKNMFPIPVYLNTMRKNLLFSVYIKNESDLSNEDWYQRGIALISWNKTYEYKSGK